MLPNRAAEVRTFPRRLDSLKSITEFADEYLGQIRVAADDLYAVQLAIEELFTNMLRHSFGGSSGVTIGLSLDGGILRISLIDYDVPAWDPRQSPVVNVEADLDERIPGGLGLLLVKSMVDIINYEHKNGNSTVVIARKLTVLDV